MTHRKHQTHEERKQTCYEHRDLRKHEQRQKAGDAANMSGGKLYKRKNERNDHQNGEAGFEKNNFATVEQDVLE
jgi:hypothetical protein